MKDNINELIAVTLDNLKKAGAVDNVVGRPIPLPDGGELIPLTKISLGFATGGGDYSQRPDSALMQFAGGGGGGVTITPIGFISCGGGDGTELFKLKKDEGKDVWEKLVGAAIGALKK